MFTRSLLLTSLLLFASSILQAADGFKIVFLPFRIETDQPVTRKSIFQSAFIQVYIKHQHLPEPIRKLISTSSGTPVDNLMIRLVIQEFDDTYFFDNKGNGITNSGKLVKIDQIEFEKLISAHRICLDLE